MYKTVRKGDASLQYTILPQTDQFSSGGFPQMSGKSRPKIIKYTMGTVMVLIILSCVVTPFLMNQNDHNLFASTMLAMSRIEPARDTSRSQTKDIGVSKERERIPTTTVSTTEVTRRKDLEDTTTSFSGILRGEEEEAVVVDDATLADIPPEITTQAISNVDTSSVHQTTTSASPPTTTISSRSPKMFSSDTTTEGTKTASTPKKPKMPRVTLKLRENETIPQMYMKAGIASYKKGNITTSVLAPRLSLEGLIFKTPEGTIKPWPQKWFFSDPSVDFQWKGSTQMPLIIYIAFAGLAIMTIFLLFYYVHHKALKLQQPNIEEPEVAESEDEEDKSILLNVERQEIEEKE